MSAEGCESSVLGLVDAGEAREMRQRPCPETWCFMADGHPGHHAIAPFREMPAPDYSRGRSVTVAALKHAAAETPHQITTAVSGQHNASGGKP